MAKVMYAAALPETNNSEGNLTLFVGKPKLSVVKCDDCGQPHAEYTATKGSRVVMEELCDAAFSALGISKKVGGLYKLTIEVEEVK